MFSGAVCRVGCHPECGKGSRPVLRVSGPGVSRSNADGARVRALNLRILRRSATVPSARMRRSLGYFACGATLAQSVEQLIRNQQVAGSNPAGGSKKSSKINGLRLSVSAEMAFLHSVSPLCHHPVDLKSSAKRDDGATDPRPSDSQNIALPRPGRGSIRTRSSLRTRSIRQSRLESEARNDNNRRISERRSATIHRSHHRSLRHLNRLRSPRVCPRF